MIARWWERRRGCGEESAGRSAPTSVGVPVGGTVLVLGVLSVLLCLVSLAVGSHSLTLEEVAGAFVPGRTTVASVIVWQLRMPRTVLAVMVGASLAVAGVVMQGLTRNPLAEPGILGINAGASLSVVLSMSLLGLTDVSDFLWFAFAGAALAAFLVHLMSVPSADAGPARLVLAGVALGASLRSITGTITMYDSVTFDSYRFWVLGSLADRDAVLLVWVAPFLAVGLVLALASGLTLNALALGEEQAKALGVSPRRARALALTSITLLCGASTAAVGPISFVGLVVPHVLRLALGADQRKLLAVSVVAGPVLLLAADILGRVILDTGEMEAGVVTAFIGGPVLLLMVIQRMGVRGR